MPRRRHEEEDDEDIEEEEDESPKRLRRVAKERASTKKAKAEASEDALDMSKLESVRKPSNRGYEDSHRALLQYMMNTKFEEEKRLNQAATRLGKPEGVPLKSFIDDINAKLVSTDMYMQIRSREMVEFEGTPKIYALINTKNDEVAKKSSPFDVWQLVLMNHCINLLALSENGVITVSEVSHAASDLKQKRENDFRTAMNKFADLGWLRQTERKGHFTAGPRMMLELSEVLREKGVTECAVSKQVVVKTLAYQKWLEQIQTAS